ncbi:MAG: hypothetical protein IK065_06560 [Neisseriaceae bacterium]|nr:hypothetical protein [Neisseriaceae bacterium]
MFLVYEKIVFRQTFDLRVRIIRLIKSKIYQDGLSIIRYKMNPSMWILLSIDDVFRQTIKLSLF